ncbi:GntR family transcriptional regulator [Actinoplanes friuliensis DSM 7358]|uniref:GntR family transcriptional regulator n=1 Tax=Actinoplanes friuliensis DSM 7358 TaxID=1246995 RepID=U5VQE1_9ACTN|nr:GntR family transcriptional regulator [Actinoplanes friuliensis DSM 7358]
MMRRAEVREKLRELIDSCEPGDALPSERDLSDDFGASRPTIRAAIEELAQEGLLVRRHGRGTFTNHRKISQEVPAAAALPPAEGEWDSEVLEFGVVSAGARLSMRLQVSPGDDVIRALRRRVVDAAPIALEEIRLPLSIAPGLTADDFAAGSLYRHLRERHGITPATAVQTTEPTVTDAIESRLLGVPRYSPALLFERTTSDTHGRVIEFARSVYRGDRYRITNHLTFGPESG